MGGDNGEVDGQVAPPPTAVAAADLTGSAAGDGEGAQFVCQAAIGAEERSRGLPISAAGRRPSFEGCQQPVKR